jgi:hypothetical protein
MGLEVILNSFPDELLLLNVIGSIPMRLEPFLGKFEIISTSRNSFLWARI